MNDAGDEDSRRTGDAAEARARRRAERRRLVASGPASPCISVCQLDDRTGWCLGCYRTIDEIRDWIIMLPEERVRVLDRLAERRSAGGKQP
jgi:predicted Fe-S protein YdhL (DUF1289 family)